MKTKKSLLFIKSTFFLLLFFLFFSFFIFKLYIFVLVLPNIKKIPQNIKILYLDMLLIEFSWQEYWSSLPFPPPLKNVSSELFTMTRLSWVALHSMAQRFWVTQALLPWQGYDLWRGLLCWRDLHNSVKCWAMPCRTTQDRQVKV